MTGPARDQVPQVEVIPLAGVVDLVAEHLPPGHRITVTNSPAQGTAATISTAVAIRRLGHEVVPHLAARRLRGPGELREVLDRLTAEGVTEVFAVAGDGPRLAGAYPGSLALLEAITQERGDLRIGIAVHPEGHPFLDPDTALAELRERARTADHAVTQMCFEAAPLLRWLRGVRRAGIALPVRPGIAAPVRPTRLLRVGARIGVGRSLRMLSQDQGGVRGLVTSPRWQAESMLEELDRAVVDDPGLRLAALHVYSLNDLPAAAPLLAR